MERTQRFSSLCLGILVAIGCGSSTPPEASAKTEPAMAQTPAAAPAQPAAPAAGSAAIRGTVKFTGTAPKRSRVQMDADPVCQQQHAEPVYTEEVVANEAGGLKNVLVYVKEGASGPFPAPAAPVVLDQKGCWYNPHVFGIQVNQPLQVVNNDPTLHNVNAKPTVNPPFNIAQPAIPGKAMKTEKKFAKPEVGVKFKCNVHSWMSAFAGVFEHPYFGVSDADGNVAITGLPAGTYVIEAWHETLGTQTQTATVGDGESKTVEFSFSAP